MVSFQDTSLIHDFRKEGPISWILMKGWDYAELQGIR